MSEHEKTDWVELSHPINEDVVKQSFLPKPKFRQIDDASLRATEFTIVTHVGTHLEAPSHLHEGGKTIDDYPVNHFVSRAFVKSVDASPHSEISVDQVSDLELGPGDALLIRTGWEDRVGDESYSDQPYLSKELAEWIVEQGVSWVGVDSPSPEMAPQIREDNFEYPVHSTLLENDVLIAEHLTNLSEVKDEWIDVIAIPLDIEGADGSPTRIVGKPLNQ